MTASSRPLGRAGDILSLVGVLMMAFSGYVLWQEGPTALFVTLNPNPASYSRRVGGMARPPSSEKAALLNELYRFTPTPGPTPIPSPTLTPTPAPRATAMVDTRLPEPAPPLTLPTPTPGPGSEAPTHLLIPSIGVDTDVVEVGFKLVDEQGTLTREWETADYAAGHHVGSANPGGQGNVVISGHNNIQGRVFRLLERLTPDDEITLITASGRRYRYVVREQVIVPEVGVSAAKRRENASYIAQTDDARLTLVSCWPYWTNTHRVIVVAEYVGLVT